MNLDVGSFVTGFPGFVARETRRIEKDVAVLAVDGCGGRGRASVATDLRGLKDEFINLGGGVIGYAELLGVKYGVKPYRAKVSEGLSRGTRLTDAEFGALRRQGFKSVVNLCLENDDDTARAKAAGMTSLRLKIVDNTAPTMVQMKQFLDFATQPANQPVYVHCEQGRGRTGVAAAVYRMAVQGWTPARALAEADRFKLGIPAQRQFIRSFGAALAEGRVKGYPLVPCEGSRA